MKKCPFCGKNLKDQAIYCPDCCEWLRKAKDVKVAYESKLRLSSIMYSNYLKEVEESEILKCKIDNRYDDNNISFKSSLARSRNMAINEFRLCHSDLVKLFEKIHIIEEKIIIDIEKISNEYPSYKDSWDKIFDHFNLQLSKIFKYASDSLISSFSK
jgi:hypothetical protein